MDQLKNRIKYISHRLRLLLSLCMSVDISVFPCISRKWIIYRMEDTIRIKLIRIFPAIIVFFINSTFILYIAMKILTHERESIIIGIHTINIQKIHERFTTMIFWVHSVISRSMSSVSPLIRKDLKSQL